jgi:magnesium-protoporphyrin O-methyltransferase
VSGCCRPAAYADAFDEKQARKDARRYRRKGLPRDAAFAVDFLRRRKAERLTVLEVGGGVGALQIELLRAGAATAVNVELSPAYEGLAKELLREAGFPEQAVDRRLGDFVERADDFESAEAVVLNRVVCCYPDGEALVAAAAAKTSRYLVLTYPPDHRLARLLVAVGNWWLERRGVDVKSYAHSHAAIQRAAEAQGLRLVAERRAPIWSAVAFERAAAA